MDKITCSFSVFEMLEALLAALSYNIQHDYTYNTQEASLEIVARIFYYLEENRGASDKSWIKNLVKLLPAELRQQLTKTGGCSKLLSQSMRPILNELNKNRENDKDNFKIHTFAIKEVMIQSSKPDTNEVVDSKTFVSEIKHRNRVSDGWLDIEMFQVSLSFEHDPSFLIILPFGNIKRIHFSDCCLQVSYVLGGRFLKNFVFANIYNIYHLSFILYHFEDIFRA